ncbi:MAG: site-specific DNA-methyltransferase [Acidobacteria bacterium]|nr:MAG: site-specific DNA-methyltransferase [Acidobacteriota bacterium]
MLQQDQRGRGRRMEGLPTVLPVKARQMLLFKENGSGFSDPAFTENRQEPIHRWVPWVAGFSSQFVREAIEKHLPKGGTVLDPFAGVGTTLVETIRRGPSYRAVGFEVNPYAAFAAQTKLDAVAVNPSAFRAAIVRFRRETQTTRPLMPPAGFRSRVPFFSPRVEAQVLRVLAWMEDLRPAALLDLFRLAFASVMVKFSNYTYEPSLGTRASAGKPNVEDAPVVLILESKLEEMASDMESFQLECPFPGQGIVHSRTWRDGEDILGKNSVHLVITSPPYANNYHYLRNTRPQLWWLGFATSTDQTREIEEQSFGKFWQTVRDGPEVKLQFGFELLENLLDRVRHSQNDERIYGGSGWANYLATYFNDSFDFLKKLSRILAPGGCALVVIGNSVVQGVEVKTDEIWAHLAGSKPAGLSVEALEMVRKKRVGSSILNSSVRSGASKGVTLYESVLSLRRRKNRSN